MHELAITKSLIDMINCECRKNNIKKPKKVFCELGILTSFRSDPILFYFDELKKGKDILQDIELEIDEIFGRIKCNSCNQISTIKEEFILLCPNCDSSDVDIIEGQDFRIKEII